MQINNQLESDSFHFTIEKKNMFVRSDEIEKFVEIEGYCKDIGETINYLEDIWNIEVEQGISFADWVYGMLGSGNYDDRRFFQELMSKPQQKLEESDQIISVSLGDYQGCVDDLEKYVETRRNILKEIADPKEFGVFMSTCFLNCVFADDIVREMKKIHDFGNHTDEIVRNLAVLNDEAISLYKRYHDNLKEAMEILSSKLLACSPDSNHTDVLRFDFSFEEYVEGENIVKHKIVECSPHLKLIHKGSNLRIYFQWCDKEIYNGEKVLIGRIGSHPYRH